MTAWRIRGACPTLSEPMQSGDGFLVRLVPTAEIPIPDLENCLTCAAELGNGLVEVTSRGGLQFRGFTEASAAEFARRLVPSEWRGDALAVTTNPLPDEADPVFEVRPLANLLRAHLHERYGRLPPKLSIVMDGGAKLHLAQLAADIRLQAVQSPAGPRFNVALAGDAATAISLGSVEPSASPEVAAVLVHVILANGFTRAGPALRQLGANAFRHAACSALDSESPVKPRPRAEPIGLHALRDGQFALGLGLLLGQATSDALLNILRFARTSGAQWARSAPGRALLLGPLSMQEAETLLQSATRLGFIVENDDPRLRVVACAGSPACSFGHIPARAIAVDMLSRLAPRCEIHISGCMKSCASQKPAAITVLGTAEGAQIIRDGQVLRQRVSSERVVAEIVDLATGAAFV